MRHRRNRQRQLALQTSKLTPRTTGRERFALVAPPVGLRPPYAATSANGAPVIPVTLLDEGGPFWTPIGGPFWTPIDRHKVNFTIEKRINGVQRESISHEVDHVRTFADGRVIALEIEWNNKDPFFDRDLENFKRLHAEGAISVGVIVTRGSSLQDDMVQLVRRFATERGLESSDDLGSLGLTPTPRQKADVARRMRAGGATFADAWSLSFVKDKYGAATTHWRKLEDRVHRGVGNPCPLLLIGLPSSIVTFDEHLDVGAIAEGEEEQEILAEPIQPLPPPAQP